MMDIDSKRFEKLEKKVDSIYKWALGDEFNEYGINARVQKLECENKRREKRWWLLAGGIAVVLFLIKWGGKLLEAIN